MGIPNKISPLTGGGDMLPRGYLPAEFLESTGTQYIDTQMLGGGELEASFDCMGLDKGVSTGGCVFGARLTPNHSEAAAKANGFLISKLREAFQFSYEATYIFISSAQLNTFYKVHIKKGVLSVNDKVVYSVPPAEFNSGLNMYVLAFNSPNNIATGFFGGRLYNMKLHTLSAARDYITVLDKTGTPCLYDRVTKQPFYNAGTGAFIVGMTSLQARNLSKLPIVESGALTVSLPWEAQWDTGVQNALSIAATRGWTITVQYRDPEVATANIPVSFLEFSQGITTPYKVQDYLAPKELYLDAKIRRNNPSGGMWLSLLGYNNNEQYIQRISVAGFDYNAAQHNDWACHWLAPNNRGGFKYQGQVDFSRRNKVLFKDTSVDINGEKFVSLLNGTGNHEGGAVIFINQPNNYTTMQLYRASYAENDVKFFDYVPCITLSGKAVLYNIVDGSELAVTYSSIGLTIGQALNLSKLPVTEAGTLTVSLPWEAQLVITGVPAALQVAADRGWTITVQYRDPEADNIYYNKYATCTKQADMTAVNANYKSDLTADGKWIYPLPKLSNGDQVFNGVQISEIAIEELPLASSGYFMFASNKAIKRFTTRMPIMTWFDRTFHNSSLEIFDYGGENFSPGVIQLGFNACKNFRTFNAVFGKKIANANAAFSECILDKPSVLRIANSAIPSSSGIVFTIGVHIDLQNDTEVLDALALMETNGWALTTQWNGTATAAASVSTFGLRSPAIYAKLNTIEFSDGTTEQILDWGHYVTNWEERGYQEFASLEEANEYFNINQTEEV